MRTIQDIKTILKQRKITYAELAQMSGIPEGTLKNIFSSATRNPRIDTLQAIEQALGLNDNPYADLFAIPGIEPLPEYDLSPLLGTIACGTPILAEENIEEYIKKDKKIKADFALRCKGDSMINARIFDGDIVYIRQQEDVENGEIAAVLIDNEATLKRVYKYPNRIELRPENPTFAALIYDGEQLKSIRIIGKAVAFLSVVR